LVKDRWVGPPRASIERTNYMLVFMGPVSLVVGCQHKLGFSPRFNAWLGREARYGPADHSAGLGVVSEALLLGSSGSVQIY
jgi:hypothetical protein